MTVNKKQKHDDREIIFETEGMLIETFLKLMEECPNLTDMDKKFINESFFVGDFYTHVIFSKYKQGAQTFIEFDVYNPDETINMGSDGKPIITKGGSGIKSKYKLDWSITKCTQYD